MSGSRPVPVPDTASAAFWSAAEQHQLALPRCADCTLLHFPPQLHCPHCGSVELSYETVAARGRVYSHTVLNTPPGPGFADLVPLRIGVVELDAQPMLLITTNLQVTDVSQLALGARVEVRFELLSECANAEDSDISHVRLPQFRIIEE